MTEQETVWREWLAERPAHVRAVAEQFPPWLPLRIKSTGQRAHIYSFGERPDGTVSIQVNVYGHENPGSLHTIVMPKGHRVFGLSVGDLELVNERYG